MAKCPNCGSENPDYAFYCGLCAAELKDSSGKPYVTAQPAKAAVPRTKQPAAATPKKRVRTANPVIGGVCVMISGALALVQGGILLASDIAVEYLVGGIDVFVGLWGVAFMAVGLGALLLGIRTMRSIGYEGALVGAVLGIVGMGFGIGPFLALAGLVLIALSREEFHGEPIEALAKLPLTDEE